MFKRLEPQKVQNIEHGYIVQTQDRFHLRYIDDNRFADIEVEFGEKIYAYPATLCKWNNKEQLSEEEKSLILDRIAKSIAFLGEKVEYI